MGALVASVTPMTYPVEPLGGHAASAAPMTALAQALGCHAVPMAKALVGQREWSLAPCSVRTCEVLSAP